VAVTTCKNHPTRLATTRCKRCGLPICNDCKMVTEVGVVCSQQCLDAIKAFQERVKDDVPKRRRHPLLSRGALSGLFAVVILFGIAYVVLCYRAGRLLSFSDVLDMLDGWVRFFGTYF